MNFNPMEKLQKVKETALNFGAQQAAEAITQTNHLLTLLQDAGYQVGELTVDLAVPPTVTVELKTGPLMSDSKLDGVFQANNDNHVLAVAVVGLIQVKQHYRQPGVLLLRLK